MIQELFEYINNLSAGNQMIGGAISLWFMGVITYACREVPRRIWGFCVKHATTEFVTTSQNTSFHNLLQWFEKNGYADKFRRIKVSNGKWGSNSSTTKSVGYGNHVVWYGWAPLLVNLRGLENKSEFDKEIISIMKIGRSHALFDRLITEISERDEKANRIEVFSAEKSGWSFLGRQPKRGFDSVIVEPGVLRRLLGAVDDFVAAEEWYVRHGVPYSLGILLYGPPGTGKTSLIQALASYLNRDIYIVSALGLAFKPEVLQSVEENSITVVEDIDGCPTAQKRTIENRRWGREEEEETDKEEPEKPKASGREGVRDSFYSTSDLLNAMNGIVSGHGRILVMTANHPEKIDDAVLRPGRCDLKLEIGYLNMEMFVAFLKRFFSDEDFNMLSGRILKVRNLTGAVLQQAILEKKTCREIVDKFTEPIREPVRGKRELAVGVS